MLMNKFLKSLRFNIRGSSLVEALIAVFILTMGILPSLSAVLLANSFSALIRNNLIGANLAQEGIEVVRAVRDSNWFAAGSPPWDRYLIDCGGPATCIWRVQWDTMGPLLPSSIDPVLEINSQGLYGYSPGAPTSFKRQIIITKIDPTGCNCEIRVVSQVSWLERKNRTKTISVEAHLFNWK